MQKRGYTGSVEGGINMLGNTFNYNGPMLFTADLLHDPVDEAGRCSCKAIDSAIEPLRDKPVDQKTAGPLAW